MELNCEGVGGAKHPKWWSMVRVSRTVSDGLPDLTTINMASVRDCRNKGHHISFMFCVTAN
jgi:hypothetical protein